MSDPIAILCSDIHLCHTPPVARSVEPDWYAAMARPLDQLRKIWEQSNGCVILFGGDLFDRWNSPPELINFAMDKLPEMDGVPGQHDLPHHSLVDLQRSAYWTVEYGTKNICTLNEHPVWCPRSKMMLYGAPWGVEWGPPRKYEYEKFEKECELRILVAHRYVWMRGKGYPGAPKEAMVGNLPSLKGYDVAVFGDNHQPFTCRANPLGDCVAVNCGCLIPRKQDERRIKPSVWLLYADKSVERVELDTSEDKWLEPEEDASVTELAGLQDFLDELRGLDVDSLDYEAAVRRYCEEHKVGEETRQLLLESMGV